MKHANFSVHLSDLHFKAFKIYFGMFYVAVKNKSFRAYLVLEYVNNASL